MPQLVVNYNGQYTGNLEYFSWHGNTTPPNTHYPYAATFINVTKGQTLEFSAKNQAQQPDYYVVTILNDTVPGKTKIILEGYRLDGNKFQINYNVGIYDIQVTAVWESPGILEQTQDYVRYSFPAQVIMK